MNFRFPIADFGLGKAGLKPMLLGLLIAILLIGGSVAEGNQAGKVLHVGILGGGPKERIDAFRGKLRELGWVEDVTIVYHYGFNQPGRNDLQSGIAAEFVRQKMDVIVTTATEPALAAQQATKTIPIVMAGGTDPVGWGLI